MDPRGKLAHCGCFFPSRLWASGVSEHRESAASSSDLHENVITRSGQHESHSDSAPPLAEREDEAFQFPPHATAVMQPCDHFHGHLRAVYTIYEDVAFGSNDDPFAGAPPPLVD